jgi:hypothetical protein
MADLKHLVFVIEKLETKMQSTEDRMEAKIEANQERPEAKIEANE